SAWAGRPAATRTPAQPWRPSWRPTTTAVRCGSASAVGRGRRVRRSRQFWRAASCCEPRRNSLAEHSARAAIPLPRSAARAILALVMMGLISSPIAAAIAPPLSRLWGKRRACMTLFFASVLTTNGPIVLRLLGLFPENGSPFLLPILMANAVLGGVLTVGG